MLTNGQAAQRAFRRGIVLGVVLGILAALLFTSLVSCRPAPTTPQTPPARVGYQAQCAPPPRGCFQNRVCGIPVCWCPAVCGRRTHPMWVTDKRIHGRADPAACRC